MSTTSETSPDVESAIDRVDEAHYEVRIIVYELEHLLYEAASALAHVETGEDEFHDCCKKAIAPILKTLRERGYAAPV